MASSKRHKILQQLQIILEPWSDGESQIINESTDLLTELGIDSVGILQIVLNMEKEFGISIDEQELDTEVLSRLGNFIDMVEASIHEDN